MDLVKKSVCLVFLLIGVGLVTLDSYAVGFSLSTTPVVPVPDEGDFLPDTVNVFHIAKDVSDIFIDAIDGPIYNDVDGDIDVLNKIFANSYTSNDKGLAYKEAIDQKIKAQKGDFGLNILGNYTENFTPGLSVDEDLTFKRRLYFGLEMDIIKGGLFDATNKVHQLKMESILKEYESLEYVEKENYRYLFNYINYIFNAKKLDLLKERKVLVGKQLKFTKELYHLRYVGWEKVLDYQEKLEDIEHHIYQYEKFNKHIVSNIPDTLLVQNVSADNLPLFDVELDSLMKTYYAHHGEDTITQIKLAIYKDQIKWWKDITLRPYVRYNIYVNEFNALRNYGSAGANLRVPLRFHNKQKLIRAQEMIYKSEESEELVAGDNELVNIYAEFGFKLKQIKAFYYKKMLADEMIRKELVKKEYHDVGFNPVYTLGLIDDKKAIDAEIIDLKKRMYINLVRLAFYLEDREPGNFITILKPNDFTGRYGGSVKMFVKADEIKEYTPAVVVNYLWKNEFIDVIVENNEQELSEDLKTMIDKSRLANIYYTLMKRVPQDGSYPDVTSDVAQVVSMDNSHIIGLHYEMDLLSANDTLSEISEVEMHDWMSTIGAQVVNGPVRLSIGIPSGLSISLLNRIFNRFDLVIVHETGSPNSEKVSELYSTELNLNSENFVLALTGTDFSDRIHLENYMVNLSNNYNLNNFAFSDFSSMMSVDFKTFEKGNEIDMQPGELVASVRNQIYIAEEKKAVQEIKPVIVQDTATEIVPEADIVIEQKTEPVVVQDTAQVVEQEIEPVVVQDTTQVIEQEIEPVEVQDTTQVVEQEIEPVEVQDTAQVIEQDTTQEINEEMAPDQPEMNMEQDAQVDEVPLEIAEEQIVYRIQVAASKVQLSETFLQRFKANDIREIKINEYYKYTVGNFTNEKEASIGLKDYKSTSGNSGAFIVTY